MSGTVVTTLTSREREHCKNIWEEHLASEGLASVAVSVEDGLIRVDVVRYMKMLLARLGQHPLTDDKVKNYLKTTDKQFSEQTRHIDIEQVYMIMTIIKSEKASPTDEADEEQEALTALGGSSSTHTISNSSLQGLGALFELNLRPQTDTSPQSRTPNSVALVPFPTEETVTFCSIRRFLNQRVNDILSTESCIAAALYNERSETIEQTILRSRKRHVDVLMTKYYLNWRRYLDQPSYKKNLAAVEQAGGTPSRCATPLPLVKRKIVVADLAGSGCTSQGDSVIIQLPGASGEHTPLAMVGSVSFEGEYSAQHSGLEIYNPVQPRLSETLALSEFDHQVTLVNCISDTPPEEKLKPMLSSEPWSMTNTHTRHFLGLKAANNQLLQKAKYMKDMQLGYTALYQQMRMDRFDALEKLVDEGLQVAEHVADSVRDLATRNYNSAESIEARLRSRCNTEITAILAPPEGGLNNITIGKRKPRMVPKCDDLLRELSDTHQANERLLHFLKKDSQRHVPSPPTRKKPSHLHPLRQLIQISPNKPNRRPRLPRVRKPLVSSKNRTPLSETWRLNVPFIKSTPEPPVGRPDKQQTLAVLDYFLQTS